MAKKKRFDDKVVWITGGSSGIGRELARQFAEQGAHVAVSGRRENRLNQVVGEIEERGTKGLAVPCDVTDEQAVFDAVDKVVEMFGQLDCVVANAGFGVAGAIEEVSAAEWRRQLDTNVVGLVSTARAALPELRKTNGRVVLMGSVSGFLAQPRNAPYHASKHAVRAIGQTLSMELHGSGVSCTTIHPGFVESEIGQVDNEGAFHEDWEDKRPQKLMWSTDDAARVIIDAVYKRKREFVFTGHGKLASFVGKHFPGLIHHVTTWMTGGYDRK
jgi:NADP-dependent 3-hydroxy acid dehydrogenase YdfG